MLQRVEEAIDRHVLQHQKELADSLGELMEWGKKHLACSWAEPINDRLCPLLIIGPQVIWERFVIIAMCWPLGSRTLSVV